MSEDARDERLFAPATSRNREPILRALERFVPPSASVLEIASGTGEHATFLAERLPVATWQPSDPDAASRRSIDAWAAALKATHVLPALDIDAARHPWPVDRVDVVVCINMIHISPWSACEGLMDGAAKALSPGGVLYLYGPFMREGAHTSPSNAAFDLSLKTRNPEWGVRDIQTVADGAARRGLVFEEVISMPANNLSVLFRKSA